MKKTNLNILKIVCIFLVLILLLTILGIYVLMNNYELKKGNGRPKINSNETNVIIIDINNYDYFLNVDSDLDISHGDFRLVQYSKSAKYKIHSHNVFENAYDVTSNWAGNGWYHLGDEPAEPNDFVAVHTSNNWGQYSGYHASLLYYAGNKWDPCNYPFPESNVYNAYFNGYIQQSGQHDLGSGGVYRFHNFETGSWDTKFTTPDMSNFGYKDINQYVNKTIHFDHRKYIHTFYQPTCSCWGSSFKLEGGATPEQGLNGWYWYDVNEKLWIHAPTKTVVEWYMYRERTTISSDRDIYLGDSYDYPKNVTSIDLTGLNVPRTGVYSTDYKLEFKYYVNAQWSDWIEIDSGQPLNRIVQKIRLRIKLETDSFYYYSPF
ncbi:MAG: hypothetical protein GF329_18450 [Candidatus Lokiarchaeota archaeon]|nr:hypothetical protein [Candidatus Lokiarchaeota archaeon]